MLPTPKKVLVLEGKGFFMYNWKGLVYLCHEMVYAFIFFLHTGFVRDAL